MEQVFDTIWQEGLTHKMCFDGIHPVLCRLIKDGVSQGYNKYTFDIPNQMSNVEILTYADDNSTMFYSKYPKHRGTKDTKMLYYFDRRRIRINADKCQLIMFDNKSSNSSSDITY